MTTAEECSPEGHRRRERLRAVHRAEAHGDRLRGDVRDARAREGPADLPHLPGPGLGGGAHLAEPAPVAQQRPRVPHAREGVRLRTRMNKNE